MSSNIKQAKTQWYRKWSDQFLEQGYFRERVASSWTVNLLKPYNNYFYTAVTNPNSNTTAWPVSYVQVKYFDHVVIDGTGNHNGAERNILISFYTSGY